MMPISEMQAKEKLSASIAADIEKYLGNGGKIKKVRSGMMADAGACKVFTINNKTSPAKPRTKK